MPHAPRPSRPNNSHKPPQPQPEPGFAEWHALAVATLLRAHGISAGSIPARVWRHAYVRGMTPEAAAEQAAVSAYNVSPVRERLHRR